MEMLFVDYGIFVLLQLFTFCLLQVALIYLTVSLSAFVSQAVQHFVTGWSDVCLLVLD